MVQRRTVTAVIQARTGSSRLPNKVLRPLAGRPVLGWVVRAARLAAGIDEVVVATTTEDSDQDIVKFCADLGVPCITGPQDDVLTRFIIALDAYPADAVVRLTADCPMLDPVVISQVIAAFQAGGDSVDYLSTVVHRSLPRGLDVEMVSADALRTVAATATGHDRVHVTSALYANADSTYRVAGLTFAPPSNDLRITLDTPEDALLLDALAEHIGDRAPSWHELVTLLRERPDLAALNASVRQKALQEG